MHRLKAMLNGDPTACRGKDNCVIIHAALIEGSLCRHGTKTLFVLMQHQPTLKTIDFRIGLNSSGLDH